MLAMSCKEQESTQNNLKYVDPQIGGVAPLLQPTRTRIHVPNSLVRMYPDRRDYLDDQIRSFPLTLRDHRSAPMFNIMPFSGGLTELEEPISTWDQELETASPHYYSTWLEDYDIKLEFSPGERTGFYRFDYGNKKNKNLFLERLNGLQWKMNSNGSIEGVESFEGMKAYAYGVFNPQGKLKMGKDSIYSWVSWPDSTQKVIDFKYGISFIDLDMAKRNLEKEIPDWNFEMVKSRAKDKWSKVLDQIQVEGGTEAYKRSFYTALYRCYERMVNISENDQYYSNYDRAIHTNERDFYADDWVWDTYLALHPLRYILDPKLESDMISSYIRMYEQSGWLPQFPQIHGDSRAMNGFHSTIMILDAWKKGITNFDLEKAYEGARKNAMEGTMVPWRMGAAGKLDSLAIELGYFPGLHPGEKETYPMVDDFEKRQSVAVTLAQSYDDWALAQIALELGKEDDYQLFKERANNYKKLYWKEKGFFMPKDALGNWIEIDPKFDGGMGGRDYYDENNGWTYLWNLQHDISGLQELMGGRKVFEKRMDQHFREDLGRSKYEMNAKFPDFTGIVGQFSMGNEPSFHIPYLYNFTDSPWKTQKKIRMLLNTWFKDDIFGIPGDEDGGGMSAFVVFSAMGFYPITPGIPIYTIGSPLFSKITINLPNGEKFIISAPQNNKVNKYIQSAKLNGMVLNGPWFSHEDIENGGLLELTMGPYPNKEWGSDEMEIPQAFRETN
ncbi:MAG: GH92 family glycosyl hydrolase [Flagellimonas sp.]